MRLTCVILTQGDRPAELARAVESVTAQHGDPVQVVLVVNGAVGVEAPDGVADVITLPENVGIPGGRNEGVRAASGEVVIFLDDDGWLSSPETAHRLRRSFSADPRLAVVAFRIVDPDTGRTERRHVPRLRAHDPHRSGEVTTFLGGACAVRRSALETCGPFPARFFYGHEETDFAWRAIDRGYRLLYDAGITLHHPGGGAAGRHAEYYYLNARNRVWLARRRLPAVIGLVYVGVWAVITAVREHRPHALTRWTRGAIAGMRQDAGERNPISWRTVARMTALGRPPVI